eukprot:3480300-Lingulodinium_polyedra.AAC.1
MRHRVIALGDVRFRQAIRDHLGMWLPPGHAACLTHPLPANDQFHAGAPILAAACRVFAHQIKH